MEPILDATQMESQPVTYAGFWIRFGAAFIDGLIMYVIQTAITLAFFGGFALSPEAMQSAGMGSLAGYYIIILGLNLVYFAVMESSSYQATFGKRALGLKVVDKNFERLTLGNALGRYLAKIPSALILGIGYFMAGWTEKKQALHDMIASTYVVKS
ncbi:MAG: RDD family protein [Bacteroidetes bacterium]|nr:RDD family protein [Bacteroidota bacterium]